MHVYRDAHAPQLMRMLLCLQHVHVPCMWSTWINLMHEHSTTMSLVSGVKVRDCTVPVLLNTFASPNYQDAASQRVSQL